MKGLLLAFLALVAAEIYAVPKTTILQDGGELSRDKSPGEFLNPRVRRQNPLEQLEIPLAVIKQAASMLGNGGIPAIQNIPGVGSLPVPGLSGGMGSLPLAV